MTEINYNRKEKVYVCIVNGKEITNKDKQLLFYEVLNAIDPAIVNAVHQIIDYAPQLERSLWKAAEIIVDEKVIHIVEEGFPYLAKFKSSDHYGPHFISHGEENVCSCGHFVAENVPHYNGQRYCKHVATLLIFSYMEMHKYV